MGYIGIMIGLYWDNEKENNWKQLYYRVYIGLYNKVQGESLHC